MSDAWIGVDLDGTLAEYCAGDDSMRIGSPVPTMLARVRSWLGSDISVKIVTARVSSSSGDVFIAWQRDLIDAWCMKHLGQKIPITAEKDFNMIMLWDDRAVRVQHNTGRVCTANDCIGSGEEEAGEPA